MLFQYLSQNILHAFRCPFLDCAFVNSLKLIQFLKRFLSARFQFYLLEQLLVRIFKACRCCSLLIQQVIVQDGNLLFCTLHAILLFYLSKPQQVFDLLYENPCQNYIKFAAVKFAYDPYQLLCIILSNVFPFCYHVSLLRPLWLVGKTIKFPLFSTRLIFLIRDFVSFFTRLTVVCAS